MTSKSKRKSDDGKQNLAKLRRSAAAAVDDYLIDVMDCQHLVFTFNFAQCFVIREVNLWRQSPLKMYCT